MSHIAEAAPFVHSKAKRTSLNLLVFPFSSVYLAVETVQPFTFQNAIIADITLPPMGN